MTEKGDRSLFEVIGEKSGKRRQMVAARPLKATVERGNPRRTPKPVEVNEVTTNQGGRKKQTSL